MGQVQRESHKSSSGASCGGGADETGVCGGGSTGHSVPGGEVFEYKILRPDGHGYQYGQ